MRATYLKYFLTRAIILPTGISEKWQKGPRRTSGGGGEGLNPILVARNASAELEDDYMRPGIGKQAVYDFVNSFILKTFQ